MNTDDGHKRCRIFAASEILFPELFNRADNKICTEVLENKEYIDIKAGNIVNVDIFGLPTEKLNRFMLSELKTDLDALNCATINHMIAEAVKHSSAAKGRRIAGVIGSSGIFIDPFSEISFTELISAYDEQVRALDEHVDLYIIKGISSMSDMRAALLSCKKTEKPVFTVISPTNGDSNETGGISVLGGMVTAQEMGSDAFGIQGENPKIYSERAKELIPYAKIPLIADLNGESSEFPDILGCGKFKYIITESVNPKPVEKNVSSFSDTEIEPYDDFFVFTYYADTFFLEADTTEISEPIRCLPDMEETIADICKTSCDILRVEINSNDDAIDFARNANMSTLPVMFLSEDPLALRMALMLYQGIALIDSDTLIPKEELDEMCEKYGAVVY